MRKALLATDSSKPSLNAAHMLGRLAACDPDLKVTVFHVVPLPDVLMPAAAAGAPLTLPSRIEDYIEATLPSVLEVTVEALGLPPERVEMRHAVGSAAQCIVDEAAEGNYDLVVMGHRGLSPLKEFFLGSVSNAVVHRARCAILVVP